MRSTTGEHLETALPEQSPAFVFLTDEINRGFTIEAD